MHRGIADGEVLLLQHDGRSWVMLNLNGQPAYRNDQLAAEDTTGACAWAHDIVATLADLPPHQPGNTITGVRCYHFQKRDGAIHADLSPGHVHHDGHGWVLVDHHGEVIDRNDRLGREAEDAALDWANLVAPRGSLARRRRWRVNVGVFSDGSYGDSDGRLGRQRLRRGWNRLVDWARVP